MAAEHNDYHTSELINPINQVKFISCQFSLICLFGKAYLSVFPALFFPPTCMKIQTSEIEGNLYLFVITNYYCENSHIFFRHKPLSSHLWIFNCAPNCKTLNLSLIFIFLI